MTNDYFGKPLYPPNFHQENVEKQREQNSDQKNPFGNLFSLFGQSGSSPLMSLLLGMKGGKAPDISSILSKNNNPLFEALSSFGKSESNKKESADGSPKRIFDDEILT